MNGNASRKWVLWFNVLPACAILVLGFLAVRAKQRIDQATADQARAHRKRAHEALDNMDRSDKRAAAIRARRLRDSRRAAEEALQKGDWQKAHSALGQAIGIEPDEQAKRMLRAVTLCERGSDMMREGHWAEAVESFRSARRALMQCEQRALVWPVLDERIPLIEKALAQSRDYQRLYREAEVAERSQDTDQAIALFRQAWKIAQDLGIKTDARERVVALAGVAEGAEETTREFDKRLAPLVERKALYALVAACDALAGDKAFASMRGKIEASRQEYAAAATDQEPILNRFKPVVVTLKSGRFDVGVVQIKGPSVVRLKALSQGKLVTKNIAGADVKEIKPIMALDEHAELGDYLARVCLQDAVKAWRSARGAKSNTDTHRRHMQAADALGCFLAACPQSDLGRNPGARVAFVFGLDGVLLRDLALDGSDSPAHKWHVLLKAFVEKAIDGADFLNHVCPTCKGRARIPCNTCRGKGKILARCPRCNGTGRLGRRRCTTCHGRKRILQVCPTCNGVGWRVCPDCRGTGRTDRKDE